MYIRRWAMWNSASKIDQILIHSFGNIIHNHKHTNENTTEKDIMEGYSTSANTDAETSVSVGLQNTKLSSAPTASPEQLSEPE